MFVITPTLIVPDVHEDIARLQILIELSDRLGWDVVFLGDMFDTFGVRHPETADLYASLYEKPNWTVLVGNHDVHYLAGPLDQSALICSGFDGLTAHRVITMLVDRPELSRRFALTTTVHGWLISHAGVTSGWLASSRYDVQNLNEQFQYAWQRTPFKLTNNAVFDVSWERGGRNQYGGPLWADWQELAYDSNPYGFQIVGHTVGQDVRRRFTLDSEGQTVSAAVCIDTALNHLAVVYPCGDQSVGAIQTVRIPQTPDAKDEWERLETTLRERAAETCREGGMDRSRERMCGESAKKAMVNEKYDIIQRII